MYSSHNFSYLRGEDASATHRLDLLLGDPGEESCLDDDGLLGQVSLAQNLEHSGAGAVDDGRLLGVLLVLGASLLGHQSPKLVQVDGGAVLDGGVSVDVEVPHTDLEEE